MIIDRIGIPAFHTGMNEVLLSFHHSKFERIEELMAKLVRDRVNEVLRDGRAYIVVPGPEFVVLDDRSRRGVETLCKKVFIVLEKLEDAKVGECVKYYEGYDLGDLPRAYKLEHADLEPGNTLYYYRRVA